MEFTKEEWYAVEYAGYWELQTSPYYDADGKNLLDAEAVGEKEAKANAALMQAAPKMFETLKLIASHAPEMGGDWALMKAQAALKQLESK